MSPYEIKAYATLWTDVRVEKLKVTNTCIRKPPARTPAFTDVRERTLIASCPKAPDEEMLYLGERNIVAA